jgi:hypothetical protein
VIKLYYQPHVKPIHHWFIANVPHHEIWYAMCFKHMFITINFGFYNCHVTHVTTNFCSCIKQVAHDIQLHATLCIQHVYIVLIYMFIYTYQSKCNCTFCATLLAITIQLIKIWHMFKNLTISLWTHVTINFFCRFKIKTSLD